MSFAKKDGLRSFLGQGSSKFRFLKVQNHVGGTLDYPANTRQLFNHGAAKPWPLAISLSPAQQDNTANGALAGRTSTKKCYTVSSIRTTQLDAAIFPPPGETSSAANAHGLDGYQ